MNKKKSYITLALSFLFMIFIYGDKYNGKQLNIPNVLSDINKQLNLNFELSGNIADLKKNNINANLVSEIGILSSKEIEGFEVIIIKSTNKKNMRKIKNSMQVRSMKLFREYKGDDIEVYKALMYPFSYERGDYLFSICVKDSSLRDNIKSVINKSFS